jgi:hypothetical protein
VATKDEGISFFALKLGESGSDCARLELCKHIHATMQEKIAFFTALTSTAIAVAPRIGKGKMQFNGRSLTIVWNVCGPPSIDFAVGYSGTWRASCGETMLH